MPETIIVQQATLPVGQSCDAVIIGRDGRTEVQTRANVTRISDDFIRVVRAAFLALWCRMVI